MAVIIKGEKQREIIPRVLEAILPYRLVDEIKGSVEIRRLYDRAVRIEEIRLRRGRAASVTAEGRNIILSCVLDEREMDNFLAAVCERSLYAHSHTINNGYITLGDGIRIGICGKASFDGQKILGVYDVSSMNIRLPRAIMNVGEPICRLLRSFKGVRGVLIYSPPGIGKTTLLRAVASKMASGDDPWRVCVADTRGELGLSLSSKRLCIDILSGYPRNVALDIATRTMSAQLVVCDEIGDVREAEAIIAAQNCGVPFVASAHSESINSLLRRTAIRRLHNARIFGAYVGIERVGAGDFLYDVTSWEEADGVLQTRGSGSNDDQRLWGSVPLK